MKTIKQIREELNGRKDRSAWDKGVTLYALDIIEDMADTDMLAGDRLDEDTLLNGATTWSQYSYGGCAMVHNDYIAERLCSPSEYKKCLRGERRPNRNETWLDVQARALTQACKRVVRTARKEE